MTSRWLVSLVIALALAAPVPARAQKHGKQLFDMQKVEVPTRAATASAPKPNAPAGPQLTWEAIANHKAEYIQKIVDAQIAQLRRLIKLSSPDDPQLPDYWFRLGELYVEKYRFYEHRARSLDEPIFRAEHEQGAPPATEQRKQQQSDQDKAGQSLRSAVSDFVVAAKHAGYPRMDEVLYRLGYLLQQSGHAGQARPVFHRLLKEHPQSRYVADAYLAFADDFFAAGDLGQARAFYDKVVQFPRSGGFGYALYKRAWTEANQGDYQEALRTFVELLGHCQDGSIATAQRTPLEKEARRDLARVYARTPGADPARAGELFRRVGGNHAHAMLQALAEAYWEEGMAASSSRTYHRVMALEPRSPSLCAWQDKVLRNTLSAGSEADQVQELRRLGQTYRYVAQSGGLKADVLAECRSRFHDSARELAFVLHKQAQRTKQLATYRLAAEVYREFLGSFEAEPRSVEVAFYFAECLWQVAALAPADESLWRQAAEQYTRVVHLDPKSSFVKDAAYAAVLAWQNALYENDADLRPARRG